MAGSSRKAIYAALIGNSLIAVTKFAAAVSTGSAAMMSEGIHSLVDTGNQVLLLVGLRRATRPPSRGFPFGHGKEIYFWSFVVAMLIFALGAVISLYHGYQHILHPELLTNANVNYIVLSLAIVFEAGAFWVAWREFSAHRGDLALLDAIRRGKDPSLFVVLFEDGAAMLGLLVALAGVALTDFTGNPLFDGMASLLIGVILAATAAWLAYETQSLLIGESAADWVVDDIRRLLGQEAGIKAINEIATLHMGPAYIVAAISVDFDTTMSADEIQQKVAELTRGIRAIDPSVRRVFIEAEDSADHRREIYGATG